MPYDRRLMGQFLQSITLHLEEDTGDSVIHDVDDLLRTPYM